MLLLVAACGGSTAMPTDAGTTDVLDATDAPADAVWSVGAIKVTARTGGINPFLDGAHASVGTAVIFTDATQQTQVVVTDSDGVATATVTGPTTVTHVQTWNTAFDEAMTVVSALPGDEIMLERVNRDYTPTEAIQVQFTPAASTGYFACTACKCESGTTSPISVAMTESCQSDPAAVVLLATNTSTGTKTYASGMTAYDRISGGTISLTPETAVQSYAGTFTGIPPEVSGLTFEFVAGINNSASVMGPASSESLQVQGWQGLPGRLLAYLLRSDYAMQVISEDVTAATTSVAADAGALLPWLGLARFDVPTATFHAPSLPGGAQGDVFIGTVIFTNTSDKTVVWTVIAEKPGTFALPSIPANVFDATPKPGSQSQIGASMVFAADTIAGYREALRDPLRMWRAAWYGGGPRMHRSESASVNTPYVP
jgi:hypothetical protein